MIIGLTIFFAILFVGALIVVDILYGIVDPRIGSQRERSKSEVSK